jgi:peptide/nickel transport system substrate-binding protein
VGRQIHDSLVRRDEATGEISPCLADEWEQVDELTYRFHIRDDVYFHNGDKLTTEDILYNFERLATMPATKSKWTSLTGKTVRPWMTTLWR